MRPPLRRRQSANTFSTLLPKRLGLPRQRLAWLLAQQCLTHTWLGRTISPLAAFAVFAPCLGPPVRRDSALFASRM